MDSVRVTPQPCRGHGHLCASLDGDLMLSGMVHQLTLCRRGMSAKACKPNLWKSRRRLSDRQRATAVHSLCLFLVGAFFASLAVTLSTTLSLSLPLSLSPLVSRLSACRSVLVREASKHRSSLLSVGMPELEHNPGLQTQSARRYMKTVWTHADSYMSWYTRIYA